MELERFARERIKEAKVSSFARAAYKAGKGAASGTYKGLRWLMTSPSKVKPKNIKSVARDLRAYAKDMTPEAKAAVEKLAKGDMSSVSNPVSFLRSLVKKHGLRELSPMKPMLLGAAPLGAYRGVTKGRAKLQTPKPHGRLSPQIYQDPTRRLY